ncbi:MAG TPA: ABC transporter ATP-binding protein [Planctomycetota bacterium]|nr:ABC transporter ATP-binding protein [Planctomycetota bacterium]
MIEVEDLVVRYGDAVAVDGVSFSARPGELFGLLGPNGAGKSSTIACLSGLRRPSGGRVRVLGRALDAQARAGLGIVPQELALYTDLSARANLAFWGEAWGLTGARLRERVEAVLESVGLSDRADEKVERFSGGMQRRLNFGCGIVHEPRVLLLDEPTVGVDPQSRVRLLELVRTQAQAGVCVLYTTHYMEEAEELCDRLAILDHGELLAEGTLSELRARLGGRDMLRLAGRFDAARVRERLAREEGVEVVQADDDALVLAASGASRRLPELFGALAEVGAEVRETTLTQPSLESLFIQLTGKELRE